MQEIQLKFGYMLSGLPPDECGSADLSNLACSMRLVSVSTSRTAWPGSTLRSTQFPLKVRPSPLLYLLCCRADA